MSRFYSISSYQLLRSSGFLSTHSPLRHKRFPVKPAACCCLLLLLPAAAAACCLLPLLLLLPAAAAACCLLLLLPLPLLQPPTLRCLLLMPQRQVLPVVSKTRQSMKGIIDTFDFIQTSMLSFQPEPKLIGGLIRAGSRVGRSIKPAIKTGTSGASKVIKPVVKQALQGAANEAGSQLVQRATEKKDEQQQQQ
jgi:hypothetical protein